MRVLVALLLCDPWRSCPEGTKTRARQCVQNRRVPHPIRVLSTTPSRPRSVTAFCWIHSPTITNWSPRDSKRKDLFIQLALGMAYPLSRCSLRYKEVLQAMIRKQQPPLRLAASQKPPTPKRQIKEGQIKQIKHLEKPRDIQGQCNNLHIPHSSKIVPFSWSDFLKRHSLICSALIFFNDWKLRRQKSDEDSWPS